MSGSSALWTTKQITTTYRVSGFHQLPSFYQQYITCCNFTGTTTTDNIRPKNCICTKESEQNYPQIKTAHLLGNLLLKNLVMPALSVLHGDLSCARVSAVPLKERMDSNINGGTREKKERNELTRNGNVKCSSELANMKYISEEERFQKNGIYNLYTI